MEELGILDGTIRRKFEKQDKIDTIKIIEKLAAEATNYEDLAETVRNKANTVWQVFIYGYCGNGKKHVRHYKSSSKLIDTLQTHAVRANRA